MYQNLKKMFFLARYEEGCCGVCVFLFDLLEVKDRASEVVWIDATFEYSRVEIG